MIVYYDEENYSIKLYRDFVKGKLVGLTEVIPIDELLEVWERNKANTPQTDEEYINNLPWTEAGNGEQTDIEIARAIVHKAIDDAAIAEDAYPDLRQKMHDAVDNYEPRTERSSE